MTPIQIGRHFSAGNRTNQKARGFSPCDLLSPISAVVKRPHLQLATALTLLLAAAPSLAQAQTPGAPFGTASSSRVGAAEPAQTYRVAGTVVSAIDGQPLQHAEIELAKDGDKPSETTTSDEYGRFVFTGVPAGQFTLAGEARGYLHSRLDAHGDFSTAVVTGAGVDTESLTLRLAPLATISGAILSETGEPVENAQISLFRRDHNFGDDRLANAGFASTNDLGQFDFPRLPPGDYFLAVSAKPWYAFHAFPPQPPRQPQPNEPPAVVPRESPTGIVNSVDSTLDVAYPVTFYPGVTQPDAAQPIHLNGGESFELSLALSPLPAVTLTVTRPQTPQGQLQSFPQLYSSFHGESLNVQASQTNTANAVTTYSGLAPGDYLLATSQGAFNGQLQGTPIHLTGSTTEADLSASPAEARIVIALKTANGSPAPSGTVASLVRAHSHDWIPAPMGPKGSLRLNVPPGDYYFEIAPGGVNFVQSVLEDDRPLPSNDIHIDAGASPSFTVTYTKGTHRIEGFARQNGQPAPGAFILLLPSSQLPSSHTSSANPNQLANPTQAADPTQAANSPQAPNPTQPPDVRIFFRDQSNLDGSFSLCCLVPGDYTLLAIDSGGWTLDWKRPEVFARFLPAAVPIHIPDSAPQTLPLPTPLTVQPSAASLVIP